MRIIFDEYSVLAPPFRIVGKAVRAFHCLGNIETKLRTIVMANAILYAALIIAGKLSDDVVNETKLGADTENQPQLECKVVNKTKVEEQQ